MPEPNSSGESPRLLRHHDPGHVEKISGKAPGMGPAGPEARSDTDAVVATVREREKEALRTTFVLL